MPNLTFVETHRYNFPVATTGTGVALTVAQISNDPYLVFLTQTSYDDEFVYLMLGCDVEIARHATPPGRETTGGIGYDRLNQRIWCTQGTSNHGQLFAVDPITQTEVANLDLSAQIPAGGSGHGLATNGFFLILSDGNTLEMRTMGGFKLGEKSYPGRNIRGVTKSPWSWSFVDSVSDEIVIVNPFGTEIATAPAPGTAGGSMAIAYNDFHGGEHEPQQWICPLGTVDNIPGSIHNPDTPWNPAPWSGRHRIYVANQTDQIIYAGYLTN